MKSLGWTLIKYYKYPYRRRHLETHTEGRQCEDMQEDSHQLSNVSSLGHILSSHPQKEPTTLPTLSPWTFNLQNC